MEARQSMLDAYPSLKNMYADGKTYRIKVTVKKYKNPISSVKIGSTKISGSKFKSTSNYFLKLSKFKGKKTKVTIKLAKGWDFYYKDAKGRAEFPVFPGRYEAKGYPLINGKTKKISKSKTTICLTVVQKSTGRTEKLSIIFK